MMRMVSAIAVPNIQLMGQAARKRKYSIFTTVLFIATPNFKHEHFHKFLLFFDQPNKITVFLQLVNFISFLILILNEAVCSSPKASKMKFTELFI